MPDESTRLGSDTELTRQPTQSTRFRVKTRGYIPEKLQVLHFRANVLRRSDHSALLALNSLIVCSSSSHVDIIPILIER